MNRIQMPGWKLLSGSEDSEKPAAPAPTVATLADLTAHETRYSLFGPLHYEPNYSYPLLIWLHGPQGDERQLQQIMPLVSLRNYVAVGPRGTCRAHDDVPAFHWGQSPSAIARAEQSVDESIEIASSRFHVNRHMIFLAGYGCGGTMALRVALRNPELFAGAASLGGRFPHTHQPLVALPRLRGFPLLMAQGRESSRYSLDHLCDDLKLFHIARLSVAIRQYPCGDELRTPMFRDLNAWMLERVTGQPADPVPAQAELPAIESN